MATDSIDFDRPAQIQPTANVAANTSLSAPAGPINCNRHDTHVSFFDYSPVFALKTAIRVFADAGIRATTRAARGSNLNHQIPEMEFDYCYRNIEYTVSAVEHLTYNNVLATFACMDSYVSSWEDGEGVGGAKFELRLSGSPNVIAVGHFGKVQ